MNKNVPWAGKGVAELKKTATDRTSPGRIYRHISG